MRMNITDMQHSTELMCLMPATAHGGNLCKP